MVEDVDELATLVLNTAGWDEAIAVYEEETGCSRAESVRAVENLRRRTAKGGRAGIAMRVERLVGFLVGAP